MTGVQIPEVRMTESRLQHLIIGWLRSQGAVILKTRPQPGTPVGFPDILALYRTSWIAIEVKRSAKAPFRPLQPEQLALLDTHNPGKVFVVYPENWQEVKQELSTLFTH